MLTINHNLIGGWLLLIIGFVVAVLVYARSVFNINRYAGDRSQTTGFWKMQTWVEKALIMAGLLLVTIGVCFLLSILSRFGLLLGVVIGGGLAIVCIIIMPVRGKQKKKDKRTLIKEIFTYSIFTVATMLLVLSAIILILKQQL